MATRALVGFITDKPELIATYNHYDGYPENLGKGLESHYSMPEEALKVASMGYISYMDPETGEIEAKHKEAPEKISLKGMNFEDAMYEVAKTADSFGADYVYIYDVEASEWKHVKMYGVTQTANELMKNLADYEGGIIPEQIKEASPLYTDQGEISDNIYDYADRMMGAGVDDIEDLIMYYKNNPDEIPEPMDAKFFVQYADEIAQAVKDKERYEAGDVDAPDFDLDETFVRQMQYKAGIIK